MTALANAGATVSSNGRERVAVEGMRAADVARGARIPRRAARRARDGRPTLEEAYFRLTRGAGEHTGRPLAAAERGDS